MSSNWVELKVDDGTTMRAWFARSEGEGRSPGLLVFQEAFGVNGYIRDVCGRLAGEGWNALAPELFHRTAPGFEAAYGDLPAVRPHMAAMTVESSIADIRTAHSFLTADERTDGADIGCIGFCMGGRMSFLATTAVPLRAAVSYYGGGIAPTLLPRTLDVAAPLLMFWGGRDTHIPPEQRRAVADALRSAKKPFVDVEISYADHGFFCDQRPSYNAAASALAWPLTLGFLRGEVISDQ